jgi:hypothetical protein
MNEQKLCCIMLPEFNVSAFWRNLVAQLDWQKGARIAMFVSLREEYKQLRTPEIA